MTTIFFIVDGRGLEAQATLLAATLWQHNAARYPLLAYLPERHVGAVSTPARALFDRCGVTLRPLPPAPRAWHRPYPHGNKLLAAADRRAGDWSLFLDTDMICLAPLDLAPLQQPGRIGVLPEGVKLGPRGRPLGARLCPFRPAPARRPRHPDPAQAPQLPALFQRRFRADARGRCDGRAQRAQALATLAQVAGPELFARLEAEFGDLYHAEPTAAD